MNYLLDTCLISELAKSEPDEKVVDWVLSEMKQAFMFLFLPLGN